MFYASPLMEKHGIRAVFSNRAGGCSQGVFASLNTGLDLGDLATHVHRNINRLCRHAGLPVPHQARQVHGVDVLRCRGQGQMHRQDADIMLTVEQGVALGVRTADCLPVLLADTHAGVVAAVHAGWKGTVAGVVARAIREMCALGAQPERVMAALGPCIGSCCFEVGEDVACRLANAGGNESVQWREGRCFASLIRANCYQLMNAGVDASRLEYAGHCTCCSVSPLYFSYRRDQGHTGRQLSMIMRV